MERTKYRIVNDGHRYFLQYEKRGWLFSKWTYVWKPYYDEIWGRELDSLGTKCYVNGTESYLREFTEKWKYIDEYFKYAFSSFYSF